jgi:PST family polysaccharide transporter
MSTAILARMLEPKDFGLIGMATLITGIVQLFGNFGLGAALVHKKDVTHADLCTAYWANLAAGTFLTIICIFISPLAGAFFREKAVQWVLICLAANFILSAIASVHSTLVYKNMRMKNLAGIEVGSRIMRVAVMLIAAFFGLKFWSIVLGMIAERIVKNIGFYCQEPWRPSRVFSAERFRKMFRYSRNIFGEGFVGYINQNMDMIVTGRVLGAGTLGFYQMAYNLPNLLKDYLNSSIGAVAFPVFSRVQDENERLARGFCRIIGFISVTMFPILFGLAFAARDFILVAYGSKWLPAVSPIRILCFAAALAALQTPVWGLFNAKGRPDLGLKWGLIRLPATVVAILLGAHFGGIAGIAWGVLTVETLNLSIVNLIFRILKADLRQYFAALVPAIIASTIMVAGLFGIALIFPLTEGPALVRLVMTLIIGGGLYIATIFWGFRETYQELLGYIKQVGVRS